MHPRGATTSPPTPTLGRGRASGRWLGLVLAGMLGLAIPTAAAQDLGRVNQELSDLESDTQRLLLQPVRTHDLRSDTLYATVWITNYLF